MDGDERIKFTPPEDHCSTVSLCFQHWKVWVKLVRSVERVIVRSSQWLRNKIKIATMCLGFTEENQIRMMNFKKVFEVEDVPIKAFHIPGDGSESRKCS